MKKIVIVFALLTAFNFCQAQNIFTYGNTPVSKEEFLRMYTKNNMNHKADMTDKALREYVTLYSRFKMKVAEAEALQLDTLPGITSELSNYKKQLSKSFLTDKDVISGLSKEVHDRLKKEVSVAHIMISIPRGNEKDSLTYLRRADEVYTLLSAKNANWDSIAKQYSEDKSNNTKGGTIGYITALQVPYAFENAAYATPVGAYSKPVRTTFGYHIIKKIAERPTRGEVQVAQILVMIKKVDGEPGKIAAKLKADSVYAVAKKGNFAFDTLVKYFSEDKFSINNNGELPPFSVGAMALEFENAAFALKNIGDISTPILTSFGYHIIKLIKKIPLRNYDEMKNELGKKIERDGRVETARQAFIAKIKLKNNFKENPSALVALINAIPDSNAKNGQVSLMGLTNLEDKMFSIGKTEYLQKDFLTYVNIASRDRLYGTKENAVRTSYNTFLEKTLMEYEENNLANENPEFRNLIKEYRDGIILFDLTDKSVWTKASNDSIGLDKFYTNNKQKYNWTPCFEGDVIKFNSKENAEKFMTEINKGTAQEKAIDAVNAISGATATPEKGKYEYEKYGADIKNVKANTYSAIFKNSDNSYSIAHPITIYTTVTTKTLADARGYVIADYQDYLEKQWILSMENKYPVVVNEPVFKSMIGK